jgi:hypothetical protein
MAARFNVITRKIRFSSASWAPIGRSRCARQIRLCGRTSSLSLGCFGTASAADNLNQAQFSIQAALGKRLSKLCQSLGLP